MFENAVQIVFSQILTNFYFYFLFKMDFYMVFDRFNVLMLKIIF